MRKHLLERTPRRLTRSGSVALGLLLTAAVTWLWAHEGHQPLASKGAQIDPANPNRLLLTAEARAALDVRTEEVKRQAVRRSVLAYATLVAPWKNHAQVTSRLPGCIDRLHAKPGQPVAAGQPLAEVSSLELKNLHLEVRNTFNDLELAGKILRGIEPVARTGAFPAMRLLEAEVKQRQTQNALQIARSKWRALGLPEEDFEGLRAGDARPPRGLPVLSPVSGIVIHSDLLVGRVVDPSEHLFEVLDLTAVWVNIGVLEKDLHRVEPGQPVELTLVSYPGEVFPTRVKSVGNVLDSQTHLFTVWAEVENPSYRPPRFLPGMRGQAQILLPADPKKLRIPAAALVSDGAERFVLVEEATTRTGAVYRKRNVVVRAAVGEEIEIDGDLFPGDRVVTQGSHGLAGFFVTGMLRLSAEAKKNISLRVAPVRPEVVEEVVELDGAVELPPDRRAFVSSRLPGNLQAIRVDPGQTVSAGQIVAEVASLELQNAQLELLRAHLEAELFEETLKRLRAVADRVAGRQLWETESASRSAQNRRQSLQDKLLTLGLSPEQVQGILRDKKLVEALPLRSPIDGVVVRFDQVLGQGIKAEEPLFEIHDLRSAWVKGYVAERDVRRVRLGQPARVRFPAYPHLVAEGKTVRQGGVFGADSRTLFVWVELDAPPQGMRQEMLARLNLTVLRPEPTLAVPLEAVVKEGMRTFVFVRGADDVFERRAVATGRADDRHVEVTTGLRRGEQVAVQGAAGLQTAYASVR